jgi:coenzyme F420-reducing hydrogenase delta subunit
VKYTAGLLDEIGVGGERLRMFNLSSAEGARFAEVCEEMTEAVRALGPSPLGPRPQQDKAAEEDTENRAGAA